MPTAASVRCVAVAAALAAIGSPAVAIDSHHLTKAGRLLDPVVTHTNGMRLASTTPLRSHHVYWQCDPNHTGYCGGRYYTHCRNSLRGVGERCHGEFCPPYTDSSGATLNHTHHAIDGLENADAASLGTLPSDPSVVPLAQQAAADGATAAAGATDTAAPPAGGIWLDALQTISQKMMAAEGG
ncbi:MAG: hypothetical protein AAF805_03980 [Planctomycetota bacterium]